MIEVSDGRLRLLPQAGRPTEEFPPLAGTGVLFPRSYRIAYGRYGLNEWQQVNLPLDFPTAGRFIAEGVSGSVGPVDGVLQIDPIAIAGLLRLAGPVEVPSWPEPITAGNVSSVTQHDVYVRYEGDREARTTFFAELIDAVFTKVLSSNISMTPSWATELGVAVQGGHLLVYSRHRDDQRALERLAVAGDLDRARGSTDVLGVITENAVASKADWFLRRDVRYEVRLRPAEGSARGRLEVALRNLAPSSGESADVVEPIRSFLPTGTNRQIVLYARPGSDRLGRLDGPSAALASERALRVYHTSVTIPARERVQMGAEFVVPDALEGTGDELTYRLHVMRQPVAHADVYEVGVVVPKGWTAEGDTRFIGDLRSDLVMDVTLRKTTRAKLLDTLALEPWRAVRNFFGRIF